MYKLEPVLKQTVASLILRRILVSNNIAGKICGEMYPSF